MRRHGQVVAMFDRANMKWETALMALIRDGHITLTADEKKLVEMEVRLRGHPSWFQLRRATKSELEDWVRAGKPILKAARAKAGQGKTTARKAERIRWFAAQLGQADIPIPENAVEASRLEKNLVAEHKRRKEDGSLPATERQIWFAKDLAGRCKIEVPKEALESFKACSEFITRCQEIAPPSERELQFARLLAGGSPLPDEVLTSAKACSEWIDKMDPSREGNAPARD